MPLAKKTHPGTLGTSPAHRQALASQAEHLAEMAHDLAKLAERLEYQDTAEHRHALAERCAELQAGLSRLAEHLQDSSTLSTRQAERLEHLAVHLAVTAKPTPAELATLAKICTELAGILL